MSIHPSKAPKPPELLARFNRVHSALLALHKQLLDHERLRYEKAHGPIGSPFDMLQLAIKDPAFAWLRPLTVIITEIDEFVESRDPWKPGEAEARLAQIQRLVMPVEGGEVFQQEYLRALQESPDVASAHEDWKTLQQELS